MNLYKHLIAPIVTSVLCLMVAACDDTETQCIQVLPDAIINGYEMDDENAWVSKGIVQIGITNRVADNEVESTCSGVAIANGLILTAAHCLVNQEDAEVEVLVNRISDKTDEKGCLLFERHAAKPLEIDTDLDVALLETNATILDPVEMMPPPGIGSAVTIAGFGLNDDNRVGALRFLNTRIAAVTPESITVDSGYDAGACVGDSGGPLLYRPKGEGTYRLIGILSHGSIFCRGTDIFVNIVAIQARMSEWLR